MTASQIQAAKFYVGNEINESRTVRGPDGSVFGMLCGGEFVPTAFPDAWGMDRAGVAHAFRRALESGRVLPARGGDWVAPATTRTVEKTVFTACGETFTVLS